jgi:ADP-ribosylglycohydrolase
MQHQDLSQEKLLKAELDNLRDEGCRDGDLLEEIETAISKSLSPQECSRLWERIDAVNLLLLDDPKEHSTLRDIQKSKPRSGKSLPAVKRENLEDRVLGAWLARCAGCTLGKPVEGWTREKIKAYLQAAGAYPLHTYIPAMQPFPDGLALWDNYTGTTLGNITGMVRDDDIDYTVLGLKALETYGRDFSSLDIGRLWLENLPYNSIFTAEVIAYRNMIDGLEPPRTATFRNPYREFIGAQIRGDMWGYVNPGDPQKAAEMAFRDACVSHTKNGIYGEMWGAACIAAAFVLDDPLEIIRAGLAEIPADCRLAWAIRNTMEWCGQTDSWEEVRERIAVENPVMSSIHVINNTCLIVMGLLLGKGDLGGTLCITLMGGMDTDCTCATAGSMLGASLGARKLPAEWIDPLNDRLQSMVNGFGSSCISDLAQRTCRFIE